MNDKAYRITRHFLSRFEERAIPVEHVAAALGGWYAEYGKDRELWYDRHSRVAVLVDTVSNCVVTTFRMHRNRVKRVRWDSRN